MNILKKSIIILLLCFMSLNAESLYPYITPVSVEKMPIFDDDKDGVINKNDKCPNSKKDDLVNSVGCKNEITIILLENNKRKNEIIVSTKSGSVSVDKVNHSVKIYSSEQVPTQPKEISEEEISEMFPYVSENNKIKTLVFILYFKDLDSLNSSSENNIQEIVTQINKRKNAVISIRGYTDTVGSKELNYKVSKKRVDFVANLLKDNNVKYLKLELKSFGEEDLMIQTADNVNEPLNRRVEIFVH